MVCRQRVRCYGRIQGYTPNFIPRTSTLARRIIEHCHTQMLHGGVSATMSKVQQKYWIPKLRSLVKSVGYQYNHCKRYRERRPQLPYPLSARNSPNHLALLELTSRGHRYTNLERTRQAKHPSHSSLVRAQERCISERARTWQRKSSREVLRSSSREEDHHCK